MKREKTTKVYWRESKVETYHTDVGKLKTNVTVTKNIVVRTRKTKSVELTIAD